MSVNARIAMLSIFATTLGASAGAAELLVYFGTFSDGPGNGIFVSRFDSGTGRLGEPVLAVEASSPNYLAASPDGRLLFAATRPNSAEGFVESYAIERPSGRLAPLAQAVAGGAGPCHVSVDPSGRSLLVANYTGGSVKSFRIGEGGSLADGTFVKHEGSSVNPNRQKGPHAHCIMPSPDGRFALACDLGTDRVMIYRLYPSEATLTTPHVQAFASVPPGAGPRHLVFSADGSRVHVVNEMACTLSTFAWDADRGTLRARGTVPLLPPGVEVSPSFSAAAIVAGADGRFVYATVRGHDSVSVLATGANGSATLVENVPCGGATPRGLGIDPTGRWLLVGNQRSNTVNVFAIDQLTGRLTETDQMIEVGSPVDVRFVAAELSPQP